MQKLLTAEEMRVVEENTINNFGIDSLVLMKNAATKIAETIISNEDDLKSKVVTFICGPGNNGGDGVFAAEILAKKGYNVKCYVIAKKSQIKGNIKKCLERLSKSIDTVIVDSNFSYDDINDSDILVDSIFGIGFNSNPEDGYYDAIHYINNCKKTVYSVDIPSGIHGSTGFMEDIAVNADYTITIQFPKLGLYLNDGYTYSGEVFIVDIGIPKGADEVVESKIFLTEESDVKNILRKRELTSDKKDFGKVFNFAGSLATPGAAVLSSISCLRTGIGMLKLGIPMNISASISSVYPEIMTIPLPYTQPGYTSLNAEKDIVKGFNWADAILVGPGLSVSPETKRVTKKLLSKYIEKPMVIDADGLNILSENLDLLDKLGENTVLTPHDGEMSRISNTSKEFLSLDRLSICIEKAKSWNTNIVLKGTPTIISNENGEVMIHVNKNPGLAVGGSGDVLAGILVSLMGQKYSIKESILLALYIQKISGEKAKEEKGEYSVLPTDQISEIPYAIKKIREM
ncbi:MAG: hypothetical protein CR982_06935 [Candidatus Cloacimonadota bacterium]|nr:MAG: hypothetical protein CR982_06935 [Candidatus Cloacimonadota bacterium]PIE80666.1 MAG: hypothetical protein CSA15_01830 [Candidatus Delongbacteria bacterium]